MNKNQRKRNILLNFVKWKLAFCMSGSRNHNILKNYSNFCNLLFKIRTELKDVASKNSKKRKVTFVTCRLDNISSWRKKKY